MGTTSPPPSDLWWGGLSSGFQLFVAVGLCGHRQLYTITSGTSSLRMLPVIHYNKEVREGGRKRCGNLIVLSCLGFAFLNVTSAFGMGCYR